MNESSGMSISSVVGIVFIILKLVGVIEWSWWWVTLPLWGGIVLLGVLLVVLLILTAILGD
jgi:uncharacterized membrane protein (DUF485 family)